MATYTQEDYNELKRAIATGAREVYYSDKRVVFRTLGEMRDILAEMEKELGISQRATRVLAETNKGL